jgi:hypothetical protein
MYIQKVISRKVCVKNSFFGGILKVNDDSRIRIQDPDPGSGSISQGHGSADPDPDPPQNVMDPEHCNGRYCRYRFRGLF